MPDRNWLLRSLPASERDQLLPHLELIEAKSGSVLAEPDQPLAHLYFPESATLEITSARAPRGVEVGTVGCEGMASLAAFLGGDSEPLRVTCVVPGQLWRMKVESLPQHSGNGSQFEKTLRRYALASFLQASQSAACFGLHSLDQRLARWLLSIHDAIGSTPFPLTHQSLASSLGVRRAGATVAMSALRDAGAVEYTRGRISIVNRGPLEAQACACYGIVRTQFQRLLGQPVA